MILDDECRSAAAALWKFYKKKNDVTTKRAAKLHSRGWRVRQNEQLLDTVSNGETLEKQRKFVTVIRRIWNLRQKIRVSRRNNWVERQQILERHRDSKFQRCIRRPLFFRSSGTYDYWMFARSLSASILLLMIVLSKFSNVENDLRSIRAVQEVFWLNRFFRHVCWAESRIAQQRWCSRYTRSCRWGSSTRCVCLIRHHCSYVISILLRQIGKLPNILLFSISCFI